MRFGNGGTGSPRPFPVWRGVLGEELQPALEYINPVLERIRPVTEAVGSAFDAMGSAIGRVIDLVSVQMDRCSHRGSKGFSSERS